MRVISQHKSSESWTIWIDDDNDNDDSAADDEVNLILMLGIRVKKDVQQNQKFSYSCLR